MILDVCWVLTWTNIAFVGLYGAWVVGIIYLVMINLGHTAETVLLALVALGGYWLGGFEQVLKAQWRPRR